MSKSKSFHLRMGSAWYMFSISVFLVLFIFSGLQRDRFVAHPGKAAISACEKAGQWQRGLFLTGALFESLLRLDVVTCNAAVLACAGASHWRQVLLLMRAIAGGDLAPDALTYVAASGSCERSWKVKELLRLLDAMQQSVCQKRRCAHA